MHSTADHALQEELLLLYRGVKGVAFADALDKNKDCPAVPEYGMPEYDSKPLGRLYASMPALLSSTAALQEVAEDTGSAPEAVLVRYVTVIIAPQCLAVLPHLCT